MAGGPVLDSDILIDYLRGAGCERVPGLRLSHPAEL